MQAKRYTVVAQRVNQDMHLLERLLASRQRFTVHAGMRNWICKYAFLRHRLVILDEEVKAIHL